MTLQAAVSRRGRNLSEVELRYFRMLLEHDRRSRPYREQLEDQVLASLEQGCSLRSIAAGIGVPYQTVRGWARNASQRRREG